MINVITTARKSVTISIPINNHFAKFSVIFLIDDDVGMETIDYDLVISSFKAMKRISFIYFFSEEGGEYWYSINIEDQ